MASQRAHLAATVVFRGGTELGLEIIHEMKPQEQHLQSTKIARGGADGSGRIVGGGGREDDAGSGGDGFEAGGQEAEVGGGGVEEGDFFGDRVCGLGDE